MPGTRALRRPRRAGSGRASATRAPAARPAAALLAALVAVVLTAAPAGAGQGLRPQPGPAAGLVPGITTVTDLLTAPELAMLAAINGERAAAGLSTLELDSTLTATARTHSTQMQQADRVYHTPDLTTTVGLQVAGWRTITENVGVGRSVDSLHRTFMGSRSHRAAILGRYDRVGLGVVSASGRLWVTQHYLRLR